MLKQLHHTPFAFILTAASGAGKGTIGAALIHTFSQLHLSISATTRPKRPGEEDGVHYHFLSEKEFKQKIAKQQSLPASQHRHLSYVYSIFTLSLSFFFISCSY